MRALSTTLFIFSYPLGENRDGFLPHRVGQDPQIIMVQMTILIMFGDLVGNWLMNFQHHRVLQAPSCNCTEKKGDISVTP